MSIYVSSSARMSRQIDYARANATMLRQLQTLEKASIDAKICEL